MKNPLHNHTPTIKSNPLPIQSSPDQPSKNTLHPMKQLAKPSSLRLSGAAILAATLAGGITHNASANLYDLGNLTIPGSFAAPTATLNMQDNDMILRAASGKTLAQVSLWIASGQNFAFGYWDGLGINSSNAASNALGVTALGIIDNSQGGDSKRIACCV